jgi:hypothetical protein
MSSVFNTLAPIQRLRLFLSVPSCAVLLSSAPPPYTGYDISVRQIAQDVLPQAPHSPTSLPGCPAFFKQTEVMAYGPANVPGTPFHNWPAYSIEAQVGSMRDPPLQIQSILLALFRTLMSWRSYGPLHFVLIPRSH